MLDNHIEVVNREPEIIKMQALEALLKVQNILISAKKIVVCIGKNTMNDIENWI